MIQIKSNPRNKLGLNKNQTWIEDRDTPGFIDLNKVIKILKDYTVAQKIEGKKGSPFKCNCSNTRPAKGGR